MGSVKIYTAAELKEIIEKHADWRKRVIERHGWECPYSEIQEGRADLSGADLSRADLSGADLSRAVLSGAVLSGADLNVKTDLGKMLFLIGACTDSLIWIEERKKMHADPVALFGEAPSDWQSWLRNTLGGEPTIERLRCVVDFITQGSPLAEIGAK